MKIISHRGFWQKPEEKNTMHAFKQSFAHGFGLETDIRDLNGTLVISHDMPTLGTLSLEGFFKEYNTYSSDLLLALNVKADGMQKELKRLIAKYNISNYFCFDAAIPDCLLYLKDDLIVFTRQSEYESIPAFYKESQGIWLDCFISEWYDDKLLKMHLTNGKKVCIVSPELHGRSRQNLWERLAKMEFISNDNLILCTDCPVEARRFFDEKN